MKSSFKIAILIYILIVATYVIQSVQRHGAKLWQPYVNNGPELWQNNLHVFQEPVLMPPEFTQSPGYFFRGNRYRHGRVEDPIQLVANQWSATDLIKDINVGVHMAAKSSPIGDAHTVFVGGDDGSFYALDRLTKVVLWKLYAPSALRGFHSNAILKGNRVWIGDYAGRIYCLEARTGKLIWFRQIGKTIGASPLLVGEHLFVNAEVYPENGFLSKINAWTGEMIWQGEPWGEQSHSSPSISEDGKMIFVGTNNSILFAFSTDDGREIWRLTTKAPIKGSPLVWQGRIYTVDQNGNFMVVDTITGRLMQEFFSGAESVASPALDIVGKMIFITNMVNIYRYDIVKNSFHSLQLKNSTTHASAQVLSLPHPRILMVCDNTKLCEISTDFKQIRPLFDTGLRITSTPLIFDGEIWISLNEGPLRVYQAGSL